MLVAFRSIVVALKAIVLNCLSVAAAYGILVLVFQHGVGKGLLGFTDTSGVSPVIPLLLFVILFGLSMDYHVFIVSRIRERFQRGATMDEAISDGIRSTAGVVTSAAVVMVCVFAVFATLSMLFFKQFGVGLAAAILIDATIVRGVLLPATMKLLGERNWYLPAWLEWLPHFDHGELETSTSRSPSRAGSGSPEASPPRRGPRHRPPADRHPRARARVPEVRIRQGQGLRPRRGEGRPADPASVPLRHGAGQLRRRLRHARRPREPGQARFSADRPAGHPDPRRAPTHPGAPVFRLEGGPGSTNMQFSKASRIAEHHDVVLVGYRGVDGSVRLDCPEVASALKRSTDHLGQKSFRAYTQASATAPRGSAQTASISPATRSRAGR